MKTNKEIAKLQFITSGFPGISHAEQAIRAYEAGCKWVQLRMKDSPASDIEKEARKILPVANAHGAVLLINDYPEIALSTGAHGVHLGKNDMSPARARTLLGDNFIIGGTSNSIEDILQLIDAGVDYAGLGPFRFTTTKKNLSPLLGLDGYRQIIQELKLKNQNIPLIAIGGIEDADIHSLIDTGVHGIALSGAILRQGAIAGNINKFNQLIFCK